MFDYPGNHTGQHFRLYYARCRCLRLPTLLLSLAQASRPKISCICCDSWKFVCFKYSSLNLCTQTKWKDSNAIHLQRWTSSFVTWKWCWSNIITTLQLSTTMRSPVSLYTSKDLHCHYTFYISYILYLCVAMLWPGLPKGGGRLHPFHHLTTFRATEDQGGHSDRHQWHIYIDDQKYLGDREDPGDDDGLDLEGDLRQRHPCVRRTSC